MAPPHESIYKLRLKSKGKRGPIPKPLPCPFCGNVPEWKYFSNSRGTGASGMEADDVGISCCGMELRGETHKWNNPYLESLENQTKRRIVAEWNTRA